MTPQMSKAVTRAARLHDAGREAAAQMRPAVATRLFRSALALLGNVGDPDEAAASSVRALRGRIKISLAFAESECGEVDIGLRLLDEAEADLPAAELGLLYGQRGILLRRIGRHDEAAAEFGRAVATFDPDTQAEELARARLNRSALYLQSARLDEAKSDIETCLLIAERHDLRRLAAKARHNLGLVDFVSGDLPGALGAYRIAAEAYVVHAPGMLAQLSLDRGRALVAAGLVADAEAELHQVVRRLAGQRLTQDLAEAHLSLAEVALLAAHPTDVRLHARRALQILRNRGNLRWASRARLLELRASFIASRITPAAAQRAKIEFEKLADECLRIGLLEEARVAGLLATRADIRKGRRTAPPVALRPRRGDRLDTRMVWWLTRAEAELAAGRTGGARRCLSRGLAELQVQRGRMGAVDLRSGAAVHGRALARLGLESAVRDGRAATIFHWSELSRAQALLLPPARPPADPEVAAALAELRGLDVTIAERLESAGARGAAIRAGSREARELVVLRQRRERLRHRVREHSWASPAGLGARPIATLTEVRAAIGERALVSYLDLPDRVAAFVLTDRQASVVALGPLAKLTDPLRRLRTDLDVTAGRRLPTALASVIRASTAHDAELLSSGLIDPLLPIIGDRDIVIVPTGPLFSVPWAALPPLRGRAVTVGLSASAWTAAGSDEGDSRTDGTGDRGVLAVHGPRIEHGPREVAELAARQGSRTRLLTGSEATVERVLAGLAESRVAHIAAHGHHAVGNALFSGLELADGSLMGYDIQGLAATPELVVLSACDVGQSDVAPGDEALGMVTAFAAVGARTVIAGVCRIADELAPSVMRAFYDGLEAGHGPARALADAASQEGVTGLVCFGRG